MRRFLCAVCLVALLAGCAPASSTVSSEPQSVPEPQSEAADTGELKDFCPITPEGYFAVNSTAPIPALWPQWGAGFLRGGQRISVRILR